MRLADGATAPAWNVQVGTAGGFGVTIEPTDRRNDTGLATDTAADIVARCRAVPQRLLADTRAMTGDDIINLAWRYPGLSVCSPPPPQHDGASEATRRKRAWKRRREAWPLNEWRARMASEEGQATYRRRKLTERPHGHLKTHGLDRFLVHGRKAVRAVCLLHALALNPDLGTYPAPTQGPRANRRPRLSAPPAARRLAPLPPTQNHRFAAPQCAKNPLSHATHNKTSIYYRPRKRE